MGAYEDDSGEEGQTRKRPKIMDLKKALAKCRDEESAQAQQFPLTKLLAMEIEHNMEPWLERANIHLEAKLDKANKDLSLQRRMTEHYKQRDHFARKKLKTAQMRAWHQIMKRTKLSLEFWPKFLYRSPRTHEAPTYQF